MLDKLFFKCCTLTLACLDRFRRNLTQLLDLVKVWYLWIFKNFPIFYSKVWDCLLETHQYQETILHNAFKLGGIIFSSFSLYCTISSVYSDNFYGTNDIGILLSILWKKIIHKRKFLKQNDHQNQIYRNHQWTPC